MVMEEILFETFDGVLETIIFIELTSIYLLPKIKNQFQSKHV